MAYLDHAATTPMRPAAVEAMVPWLTGPAANPSGAHRSARRARRAVDDARDVVAAAVGFDPGDVVFTSGGTEADNLAVRGVTAATGGVVVCSAVEHHAVLGPVRAAGGRVAPVDGDGVVDLDALADLLDDDVTLVSVMVANNETGRLQPIEAVAELVRRRAGRAVLHVDAVQALAWLDLTGLGGLVDLVSVSAHKLGGPQGVGALIVRPGVSLTPMLLGGGQERGRRSGTHNVPGIVGLAAALVALEAERDDEARRVGALRDRLADALVAGVPGLVETGGVGSRAARLPGHVHVRVPGLDAEALLFLLERAGVDASAAASCSSGAARPSHVLAAMGLSAADTRGAIRLSLGHPSTDADVDAVLSALPAAVDQLRRAAA